MTAGSSSKANNTVRSKPCGPVMTTRNPPLNGSAAIHPSYCSLTCLPPASTATSPGASCDRIFGLDWFLHVLAPHQGPLHRADAPVAHGNASHREGSGL